MFDVWSFEHFANGIGMAAIANIITGKAEKRIDINPTSRKIINFILVLVFALMWECIEHYLEAGIIPGQAGARITHWFQGVEHWSNRLIGDNFTVLLGWYVYTKNEKLAIPARIFTALWMIVHIFAFPDSMYLHRLLFQ